MATISYILTPEGFDESYFKTLKMSDKLGFPRMTKNTRFLSRQQKLDLKGRSIFSAYSEFWKLLSEGEKADWTTAAAELGLNNWQLFVHDLAARQRYAYPDLPEPNIYHQGCVGWIHVEGESEGSVYGQAVYGQAVYGDAEVEPSEIKITQLHPKFYWVQQLIAGHKRSWKPVQITEDFALPLKIELSYFSDLTSISENSFAKIYALVWHSYQGVDYQTELKIDLDLQTGWKKADATLTEALGHIIHYDLFIELSGLTGDLYFDNIKAEHSAQNWVRDSRCNDISKTLPRTWFLIPQRWVGVNVPASSFFQSTYYDF